MASASACLRGITSFLWHFLVSLFHGLDCSHEEESDDVYRYYLGSSLLVFQGNKTFQTRGVIELLNVFFFQT